MQMGFRCSRDCLMRWWRMVHSGLHHLWVWSPKFGSGSFKSKTQVVVDLNSCWMSSYQVLQSPAHFVHTWTRFMSFTVKQLCLLSWYVALKYPDKFELYLVTFLHRITYDLTRDWTMLRFPTWKDKYTRRRISILLSPYQISWS